MLIALIIGIWIIAIMLIIMFFQGATRISNDEIKPKIQYTPYYPWPPEIKPYEAPKSQECICQQYMCLDSSKCTYNPLYCGYSIKKDGGY